eukprot:scaffold1667_cov411-Prasinococcus_capsulatus_cf.AAC.9
MNETSPSTVHLLGVPSETSLCDDEDPDQQPQRPVLIDHVLLEWKEKTCFDDIPIAVSARQRWIHTLTEESASPQQRQAAVRFQAHLRGLRARKAFLRLLGDQYNGLLRKYVEYEPACSRRARLELPLVRSRLVDAWKRHNIDYRIRSFSFLAFAESRQHNEQLKAYPRERIWKTLRLLANIRYTIRVVEEGQAHSEARRCPELEHILGKSGPCPSNHMIPPLTAYLGHLRASELMPLLAGFNLPVQSGQSKAQHDWRSEMVKKLLKEVFWNPQRSFYIWHQSATMMRSVVEDPHWSRCLECADLEDEMKTGECVTSVERRAKPAPSSMSAQQRGQERRVEPPPAAAPRCRCVLM